MAEFADEYLQRPRPSDQSYIEIGTLKDLNPSIMENFFSLDSFLAHHQPQYPPIYAHNTINNLSTFNPGEIILNSPPIFPDNKKRKLELPSASCSKNISPAASNITSTKRNNNIGRGKKGKSKEKQVEKADQVIHVRAKRGQATDSHSIAERVRREKINNKLRCLQDLVPGCHKSMGMAVMLEEIINYVHSLQNQVEFLSMELAAASCSYDLNLETESSKKAQVINSVGTQEMQKWLRDRYGELNCYQSTWSI